MPFKVAFLVLGAVTSSAACASEKPGRAHSGAGEDGDAGGFAWGEDGQNLGVSEAASWGSACLAPRSDGGEGVARAGASLAGRTWYVRPHYLGPFGEGDGTSYADAWRGTEAIIWGAAGVQPGDTVYICGNQENSKNITPKLSGLAGKEIAIDGHCPGPDGIDHGSLPVGWALNHSSSSGAWTGPDAFGAYKAELPYAQNTNAQVWEASSADLRSWDLYEPMKEIRVASTPPGPDWEPGTIATGPGPSGTVTINYKPTAGHPREHILFTGQCCIRIIPDAFALSYITFRNLAIGFGGIASLIGDAVHHITFSNNRFRFTYAINGVDADAIRIMHNEFRNGYGHGAVYLSQWTPNPPWPKWINTDGVNSNDDWIIAHNKFYDFTPAPAVGAEWGDNHFIGVQSANRMVLEHNELSGGISTYIELWSGSSSSQRDNVIRYNYLHDGTLRWPNEQTTWKGGIWFSGGPTVKDKDGNKLPNPAARQNNRVYGNVLANLTGTALRPGGSSDPAKPDSMPVGLFNNTVVNLHGEAMGEGVGIHLPTMPTERTGKYLNNLVFNAYQGKAIVVTSPLVDNPIIDYNLYFTPGSATTYGLFSQTYSGLKAASAATPFDDHSKEENPRLRDGHRVGSQNPADFTPLWNSPAIDAGTSTPRDEYAQDYFGKPIYGAPDIGAIEYQPPYTMGTDTVDIGADVRVYGDGKFRNTKDPSGTTAKLSIVPESCSRTQWIDLHITTWPAPITWTETSSTVTGEVAHGIGGLLPNTRYTVAFAKTGSARARLGSYVTSASGTLSFSYGEGYESPVSFFVE